MARAKPSGHVLSFKDTCDVLGMANRNDRAHDIAAWFGVNQGRIKDAKDGAHFPTATPTPATGLPPSGPPGVKGRDLNQTVTHALNVLNKKGPSGLQLAMTILQDAQKVYSINT
jgi:hypothetical protein